MAPRKDARKNLSLKEKARFSISIETRLRRALDCAASARGLCRSALLNEILNRYFSPPNTDVK